MAFFSIGQLNLGIQLLSLYPRMSTIHPDVSEALSRLMHVMIDAVYQPISPTRKLTSINPSNMQNKIMAKLIPTSNFNECPLKNEDRYGKSSNVSLNVYFYNQWKSEIIQCDSYEDVLLNLKFYLNHIGIHLYLDLKLASKIARIGKCHIEHVNQKPKTNNESLKTMKMSKTNG